MGNTWEMNAWGLFQVGGALMYPILVCSIFAIGIIIEKFIYFSKIQTDINELKKNVFDLVKHNKIKEAILMCDSNPSPVAKILRAGTIKFGSTNEHIKQNMENMSLYEIPKLEYHLNTLATIAHVSPLLGLLGTVCGMITCFHTIQMQTASMNTVSPGDLAGGIGQALITTVAGLLVAIPAYVAYNYFVNRINTYVTEMEKAAMELISQVSQIPDPPAF